jgi:streptogrisin D
VIATRSLVRTGVIAVAAGALAAGTLLSAPATQAAAPSAAATAPAVGAIAVSTASFQGGDLIYGSAYRCVVGFNVRDSSNVYYFLTSRRCAGLTSTFYADSAHTQVLGTTVAISPPDKDYALVKYASGISHPGTVDLFNGASQDITSAATAFVGEAVRRSANSSVRGGTVTALNVTVNTAEGTVTGQIKTNICSEVSDSGLGAPLFDGTKAIGLASSSSGNCTAGGISYFQPVTEALAAYGVTVY